MQRTTCLWRRDCHLLSEGEHLQAVGLSRISSTTTGHHLVPPVPLYLRA